jgi:hypothetical protein
MAVALELIVIALDESAPSGNGTNKDVHDGVESRFTMRGIRTQIGGVVWLVQIATVARWVRSTFRRGAC